MKSEDSDTDLNLDGGDALFQALVGGALTDAPDDTSEVPPPIVPGGDFVAGQSYNRHSMIALHNRGLLTAEVKRHMRYVAGVEPTWVYDPSYTAVAPNEYRCKQGHVTREEFRYSFTDAQTGELEVDSGPMCRACILEWAGKKFRAKRIGGN